MFQPAGNTIDRGRKYIYIKAGSLFSWCNTWYNDLWPQSGAVVSLIYNFNVFYLIFYDSYMHDSLVMTWLIILRHYSCFVKILVRFYHKGALESAFSHFFQFALWRHLVNVPIRNLNGSFFRQRSSILFINHNDDVIHVVKMSILKFQIFG